MWRESTSTHLNSDGARRWRPLSQAVEVEGAPGQIDPPAPDRLLVLAEVSRLYGVDSSRQDGLPHIRCQADKLFSLREEETTA